MLYFIKQNKEIILISIISLFLMASLGIEAGYKWDPFDKLLIEAFSLETILSFIKQIFNLGRTFAPIICFVFLFFYFLLNMKKTSESLNLTIIILLSYSVFGVLGYFINIDVYENNKSFEQLWRNTYLGIQSVSFFLLLLLVATSSKKNFETYLKIIFFIVFLVYGYFTYLNLINYFFEVPNYNLYATDYNVNGSLLGYEVPRSSGISRVYLILVIGIIIYLFNEDNKKKINIIFYFFLPVIISLIFLLNSRTTVLSLFLMTFLIFISGYKNFFQKIGLILLISLISYIFLAITPKIKNQIFFKTQYNNINQICDLNLQENLFFLNKVDIYYLDRSSKCSNKLKIYADFISPIYKKLNYENSSISLNQKVLSIIKYLLIPERNLVGSRITIKDIKIQEQAVEKENNTINNLIKTNDQIINTTESQKLNRSSNDELFLYLTSKTIEELATETMPNLLVQKEKLDKLNKSKTLTEKERLLVIKKLREVNNAIRYTGKINDCAYLDSRMNNLLTGRLCHWIVLLDETGFKFFGNGPKFDRHIVKWGASSGLVYSYVTSGIFGIIFYLYICAKFILFAIEFCKNRFINFNSKLSIRNQFIFIIIFYLLIRSIIEVGFGYWGVDQLIFLSLFSLL